MGIFNKLLLLVLVLAVASPFILKKPDGTPYMDINQFLKPVNSVKESVMPTESKQLYRWKDEKGNWQYTDHPPSNPGAESFTVKHNINEMKTIDLPEGYKEKPQEKDQRFDPTEGSGSSLPLTTAPIEKVPEMLDQIENIQQNLDNRQKQLDNL